MTNVIHKSVYSLKSKALQAESNELGLVSPQTLSAPPCADPRGWLVPEICQSQSWPSENLHWARQFVQSMKGRTYKISGEGQEQWFY